MKGTMGPNCPRNAFEDRTPDPTFLRPNAPEFSENSRFDHRAFVIPAVQADPSIRIAHRSGVFDAKPGAHRPLDFLDRIGRGARCLRSPEYSSLADRLGDHLRRLRASADAERSRHDRGCHAAGDGNRR
ncbi:MAG: hypothetical protein ISN28_14150 [Ectothiorhodospiraceae bacterium AqS1]|nr:hypothetical protein [Ectothiorhodospiraceae bacterium AqS1]